MNNLLRTLIMVALAIPLMGACALLTGQESLLFHPNDVRVAPEAEYIEEVEFPSGDGENLVAWYTPPAEGCPVLLFLHGNAGELHMDKWRYQRIHANGAGMLALAWRGYSGSSGKPSEAGFHLDASAAWQWLMAHGYHPSDIVVEGFSIGSGPAVRLAAESNPGAVILEAPYYSVRDLLSKKAGGLPIGALLRHPFRSDLDINKVKAPLLIAHGDADRLIPISQSQRLFDKANEPKTYKRFEGSDHNTLVRDGLYEEAIWPFLAPLYPDCPFTVSAEVTPT
ncbi:alpha/beta hydrolase [Hyphomonas sp. WL0036]|uniref:alpha/beta hydrolase n=1 Tax=Hyphomonas sediminis TaxID=2866160 RepID=UPI001C818B06|nr:alpha/beta hydrolase [Hyphomonas sediminis]MBY9066846.1 alpha/beta hydrolase [Hyphomonas sediminis]